MNIILDILNDIIRDIDAKGFQVIPAKHDGYWVRKLPDIDLFGLFAHNNDIKVFLDVGQIVTLDIRNPDYYEALMKILNARVVK